jgi:hypothetical protein
MRKKIMILITLLSLGILGGGLYTALANLDSVEPEMNEYAAMDLFPYEMPDVIMYPGTGYCLL